MILEDEEYEEYTKIQIQKKTTIVDYIILIVFVILFNPFLLSLFIVLIILKKLGF